MVVQDHRGDLVGKYKHALAVKESVYSLAESGQTTMALASLLKHESNDLVESRILSHSRAEILMMEGKTKQALEVLLLAKQKCGSHVSLLTDIVICYYALSDFKRWRFALEELKSEFIKCKDILIFERRAMAELHIAKFSEEDGEVALANETYSRLTREMSEQQDMGRFYRVLSQNLRVLATFRINSSLFETYRQMISISGAQVGLSSNIDVQQALLLAELQLVGPKSAQARLNEIINNRDIALIDIQIIYYDFLEEYLLHYLEIDDSIKSYDSLFKRTNPFESAIRKLAFDSEKLINFKDLVELSTQLPISNYLRILGAYLTKVSDEKILIEIRKQMRLIILSLSSDSQQYWLSRYRKMLNPSSNIEVRYDNKVKSLQYNGKSSSLAKRAAFQDLIEMFFDNHSLGTEEVISRVWNIPTFDPIFFERLRITIRRFNELIFELTGIPKAVEIKKHQISLNKSIVFTKE